MSWYCSCQVLRGLRTTNLSTLLTGNCTQNGMLGAVHIRFNKNKKQRVKDAKTQVDKNKKFIGKKNRMKSGLSDAVSGGKSKILAERPIDNVWIRKFYPQPRFSIEEAVNRHKAFAQPSMLDNEDGLAYLDMSLDFKTNKQKKFLKNIRSTILLPFPFNWGPPPSILVFCMEEEHTNLALSLGAKQAGSPSEIIKMIENGVLNPKDFTHVLATADCGSEIMPARTFLRDKFPQRAKGNIGTDLKAMWQLFYTGYTYESHNLTEAQGRLQVPLGQLKQPTNELVANFETYIDSVCKHYSIALGPFIQSICVVSPPSPEEFILRVEDYVPGYKNEEFDSDDDVLEETN